MGCKIFISQPMRGLTDEEVLAKRLEVGERLRSQGNKVFFTYYLTEPERSEADGPSAVPLVYMARSISQMALADAVYFCKGWEEARGCRVEHKIAEEYGLEIMYEE